MTQNLHSAGDRSLTRYEAAVPLSRVLSGGALADAQLTAQQLQTLARGVAEVAGELGTVSARVAAIEHKDGEQDARLAGVEGALAQLNDAVTALSQTSNPAVSRRLSLLEGTAAQLPEVVDNLTPRAEFRALGDRVSALERPKPSTPVNDSLPGLGDQVGELLPFPYAPRDAYVGLGLSGLPLGVDALLGTRALIGPIGARVTLGYRPAVSATTAELAGLLHFGGGATFPPYAGIGFGLLFSPQRGETDASATDTFYTGLVGADYNLGDRLGLFAEGAGRYYTGNRGVGTGLSAASPNGLNFSGRIGLKYYC